MELSDIPLSHKIKKTIDDWILGFHTKKQYPLLLTGSPGIGKTYLSKKMLEDTDIIELQSEPTLVHKVKNIFSQGNIKMMYSSKKKSIIIDNLSKDIKSTMKEISSICKCTYKNPLIVIIDDNPSIVKKLSKCSYIKLDYTINDILQILGPYVSRFEITIDKTLLTQLIIKNKKNIYSIISFLKYYKNKTIYTIDSVHMLDSFLNDVLSYTNDFMNKTQISNEYCDYNQKNIILMNILHNSYKYNDPDLLYYLYKSYIMSFSTNYTSDYILSIYNHLFINKKSIKIEYNKYISYSLIYLNIHKQFMNNSTCPKIDIYYNKLISLLNS